MNQMIQTTMDLIANTSNYRLNSITTQQTDDLKKTVQNHQDPLKSHLKDLRIQLIEKKYSR